MKLRLVTPLLLIGMLISSAFCQNPATFGTNAGRYGLSAWAISNQRVASQFNYFIDSTFQSGVGGTFAFPIGTCTLNLAGNKNIVPFAANASVKIVDVNSAATETVNGVAPVFSGSTCTLNLSPSNTHTSGSYILRSGTCGLREALNDLGTNGGTVIVDQKFYDDGCTSTTISGLTLAGGLLANQYVIDISNGQQSWYELKPTTTTLIAAGAALVLTQAASTPGLTNNGTYRVSYKYVDPVGGQNLSATTSAQITMVGVGTITTTAPVASTGAVGWIPSITASGGADGTQIDVPVTAAVCTLSTQTPYPTCAITSVAVIAANPSATSKENVESFAHTTFAYVPIGGQPSVSPTSTWGDFQTSFQPFVVSATLNNTNADLGQLFVPAGYFNKFGAAYDVCVKGATATQVASSIDTFTLSLTPNYAQSPVTVASVLMPTLTAAAASTYSGCFRLTVTTTGASGTFFSTTVGAFELVLNTTGLGVDGTDNTTANSSAVDLTKNLYLSFNLAASGGANVTGPILNSMTISPVNNN